MAEDIDGAGDIGPVGGERDRISTSARTIDPPTAASRRAGTRSHSDSPHRIPDSRLRMPAEWEPHEATWIAWPHHEPDWPGKLAPIPWVYGEIARVLHRYERVEILCHDEQVREDARAVLAAHGVSPDGYRLHLVPNDRVWLRDSAPTGVVDDRGQVTLVDWRFNAWAKYDNYT
ncbi:MAG TPA: agmatine deiminase family protein, partial [Gemmatimonadaceae bacterium]|nr:agmatine deiminase family protein [Gemmatimonadaceae bacterium]